MSKFDMLMLGAMSSLLIGAALSLVAVQTDSWTACLAGVAAYVTCLGFQLAAFKEAAS